MTEVAGVLLPNSPHEYGILLINTNENTIDVTVEVSSAMKLFSFVGLMITSTLFLFAF